MARSRLSTLEKGPCQRQVRTIIGDGVLAEIPLVRSSLASQGQLTALIYDLGRIGEAVTAYNVDSAQESRRGTPRRSKVRLLNRGGLGEQVEGGDIFVRSAGFCF